MSDLCPTCGIRLTEGLCQCPEVLLAEIEKLRGALAYVGQLNVASLCCHCGQRFGAFSLLTWSEDLAQKVSVEIKGHDATCPANPALMQVRSLRAKLMRERASGLEALVSFLDPYHENHVLTARARRLRAEADRIEVANA